MNIFRKKNAEENDSISISNILTNAADKIIKKGAYDRESIEFLKLSFEYNVIIRKNELDEDRFLVDKLDRIVKLSQEAAKDNSNMRGKDTISTFEFLPDLMKSIKTKLKNKERIHEEIKESTEKMLKSLDGMEKELDKFENEKS